MSESGQGGDPLEEAWPVARHGETTAPRLVDSAENSGHPPTGSGTGAVQLGGRSVLLTMGALGALLATGATAALGVVLSDSTPPRSERKTPNRAGRPITGATALRVDLLLERAGRSRELPGGPEARAGLPGESAVPDSADGRTDGPRPGPSGETSVPSVRVVREFCRLLGTEPASAVRLLSMSMTEKQRTNIVRSWRTLRSIRSDEISVTTSGRVVSTVAARDATGAGIALRYSFAVDDGADPLILRVRLEAARFREPQR
ncbi:hypothetical protein SAMN04487820_10172 [Actinopolyspora mzabensis]|uniref:Uncharacterized protein n=1 Tax=Actinopolyspora mzabensis TaxID=995066 RepID=A0A1G8VIN7_ACTMZ|nr:hypothetical protein [Actinopolyspora mzabensis]SDJ65185.1 hypothetical protein SAMN04487820_10172 [Actinopolyspora mzabensis]